MSSAVWEARQLELLNDLKEYVKRHGGPDLDISHWRVHRVEHSETWKGAGAVNYFISPEGRKYQGRTGVARALGCILPTDCRMTPMPQSSFRRELAQSSRIRHRSALDRLPTLDTPQVPSGRRSARSGKRDSRKSVQTDKAMQTTKLEQRGAQDSFLHDIPTSAADFTATLSTEWSRHSQTGPASGRPSRLINEAQVPGEVRAERTSERPHQSFIYGWDSHQEAAAAVRCESKEAHAPQGVRAGRPPMPRKARLPPRFWATLNKTTIEPRPSSYWSTAPVHLSRFDHDSAEASCPHSAVQLVRSTVSAQSRGPLKKGPQDAKYLPVAPSQTATCSMESSPETYSPQDVSGNEKHLAVHSASLPSAQSGIDIDELERNGAESLLLLSRGEWEEESSYS
eukprot:jgi/Botrbrau1/19806/Bobra.0124s0050.2